MSNELIRRRAIVRGDRVECPRAALIGAHDATVTHVDIVGDGSRSVVSLDCGHVVNMTDAHGLYRVTS